MAVQNPRKQVKDSVNTDESSEELDEEVEEEADDGEEWLTIGEAAERLGISQRYFNQLIARNPIEGTKKRGRAKLYPASAVDEMGGGVDSQEEQQTAVSTMVREVARASKEVHMSAAVALRSAAEAIQGTDSRTLALLEELKRLREHCDHLESKYLGFWELMQAMHEAHNAEMSAAAKRERERIIEGARTEVLSDGFRLAWPGLIHRFLPSKESEKSILGMAFAHMTEDAREKLMQVVFTLPPELQAGVMSLVSEAVEGESKRKEAVEKKKAAELPSAALK